MDGFNALFVSLNVPGRTAPNVTSALNTSRRMKHGNANSATDYSKTRFTYKITSDGIIMFTKNHLKYNFSNTRFRSICPLSVLKPLSTLHVLGGQVRLSHEELDPFIDANCHKDESGGNWICSLCGQSTLKRLDISRHIEAKHVTLPNLLCDICQQPSKTRDSLRRHVTKYHNNKWTDLIVSVGSNIWTRDKHEILRHKTH